MTDQLWNRCQRCGEQAAHSHHRKRRSQGGDNSPANLVRLCVECHNWVHANPLDAYGSGWMVYSYEDPEIVRIYPVLTEGGSESGETLSDTGDVPAIGSSEVANTSESSVGGVAPSPSVSPGHTCPTCERRVPHPKKPSSPSSKVFSVRVPLDDLEGWEGALDAAAEHLGLEAKPHHRYQTLTAGLALILQSPKGLLS